MLVGRSDVDVPSPAATLRRAAVLAVRAAAHVAGTAVQVLGAGPPRPSTVAPVWRRRLPGMLVRLGPSFMKVGQLLSTRRDLLAAATCDALAGLADDVPPPQRAAVERVLAQAYGPGAAPFADLGWPPVASGTIASVHRATLADGRVVAVKVRRDGIAATMRLDLALLTRVARFAGALPGLRRVPVAAMVGQVADAVHRQLDFAGERAALDELAGNFAGMDGVRVPRPVVDLCTPYTVVMEFVPDLAAYRPGDLSAAGRREVVERTLLSIYRMLFVDGLVHCDLHPGNLYLAPDASVVILDAGFVVRLPDRVRRLFAGFFLNMAMGRGVRCADIVIESAAAVAPDCDLPAFRTDLAALVAAVHGRRAHDFSLAWFAGQLFALQRRHGLYAAPEFAFPLLCLLVVEGMVNDFDSGVDFQAVAMPVLLDGLLDA